MDMNRLTEKSQAALAEAQSMAISRSHQEVGELHMAMALVSQEDGLIPRVLECMGVDAAALGRAIDSAMGAIPRVTGPGYQPGKIVVSRELAGALVDAENAARNMKDEYVSVEHIFARLIESREMSDVWRAFGITRDRFLEALTTLRGNQRVTSASPEDA
jgi:ATP-dependent Clp protease ATP-binding subunit ClpB